VENSGIEMPFASTVDRFEGDLYQNYEKLQRKPIFANAEFNSN
jgi:hypothetical protein